MRPANIICTLADWTQQGYLGICIYVFFVIGESFKEFHHHLVIWSASYTWMIEILILLHLLDLFFFKPRLKCNARRYIKTNWSVELVLKRLFSWRALNFVKHNFVSIQFKTVIAYHFPWLSKTNNTVQWRWKLCVWNAPHECWIQYNPDPCCCVRGCLLADKLYFVFYVCYVCVYINYYKFH